MKKETVEAIKKSTEDFLELIAGITITLLLNFFCGFISINPITVVILTAEIVIVSYLANLLVKLSINPALVILLIILIIIILSPIFKNLPI